MTSGITLMISTFACTCLGVEFLTFKLYSLGGLLIAISALMLIFQFSAWLEGDLK